MSEPMTDRFGYPVPAWFRGYYTELSGKDYLEVLAANLVSTPVFITSIPIEKEEYAYDKGKWTVKEVLVHMIDSERILSCRSLRFARNDQTPLPGFDEESYTPFSGANQRSMESIIDEYEAVRQATLALFRNFTEPMLSRVGTANNFRYSVEASGIVIAGHELHHLRVLRERYLK